MDDIQDILALRRAVFEEELGEEGGAEPEPEDQMAVYALACDEDGVPAGTGRLCIDADDRFLLGRICVLKSRRGLGLGDLIVRMLLDRALTLNAPAVYVRALLPAVPFYARYGFAPTGETTGAGAFTRRLMRASADQIDIEGSCHKMACKGCAGDCASCDAK